MTFLPDIKTCALEGEFIAMDVEGDGHHPEAPVELGLVEFSKGEVRKIHQWLINPGHPIDPYIHNIHGITDRMLEQAPAFRDIEEEVRGVLSGKLIVAHAASNDIRMLGAVLPDLPDLNPAIFDSQRLARTLCPGRPKYGLPSICSDLGISATQTGNERSGLHTAATDAELAGRLFISLAVLIPDNPKQRRHFTRMALVGFKPAKLSNDGDELSEKGFRR